MRSRWFGALVAAFAGTAVWATEPAPPSAGPSTVRIEEVATQFAQEAQLPAAVQPLVLFDAKINRLRGWSHLADGARDLPRPRFALEEYAIRDGGDAGVRGNVRPLPVDGTVDSGSTGPRAFHAILVKRLADWDRNHLNGIEPLFADDPIAVGDVDVIVLELRIDSARSVIPSPDVMATRYAHWLTAAQLAALDNGRAHLGVSVFEAGFNDLARPIFGGAVILEFDPARHFDRWLRVTIPADALEYFFEQNYARTPTERSAQSARKLVGLRLNPESASGRTVRHAVQERFTAEVPETLKEMAIAIRRLEIVPRR